MALFNKLDKQYYYLLSGAGDINRQIEPNLIRNEIYENNLHEKNESEKYFVKHSKRIQAKKEMKLEIQKSKYVKNDHIKNKKLEIQ